MCYTQTELNRLVELYNIVEKGKSHKYAAPTYKDSPSLKEMAAIVTSHTETDAETLNESIPVLWYLVDCYDQMCRAGLSVKYYAQLLWAYLQLAKQKLLDSKSNTEFESCFYSAVKARNYYERDDCCDLAKLVKGYIKDDKINELLNSAMLAVGDIKYDPVEKTEEYLAVIDEVEHKAEENKTLDFCLHYWSLKAEYLAEYGIYWRSPSELNPGVMFD